MCYTVQRIFPMIEILSKHFHVLLNSRKVFEELYQKRTNEDAKEVSYVSGIALAWCAVIFCSIIEVFLFKQKSQIINASISNILFPIIMVSSLMYQKFILKLIISFMNMEPDKNVDLAIREILAYSFASYLLLFLPIPYVSRTLFFCATVYLYYQGFRYNLQLKPASSAFTVFSLGFSAIIIFILVMFFVISLLALLNKMMSLS